MAKGTVSVVIPAHNCGKYLKRCIDSVLSQSVKADEIIVVDDGSTDDTAEIARGYGDKIIYVRQPNSGASTARNAGINIASGQWIAFLDGDDEWLGSNIGARLELAAANPRLRWMCANCFQIIDGSQTLYDNPERISAVVPEGQAGFNYLDGYLAGVRGHTDTMFIKKELLIEAGGFSPEQKRINDDDMWLRIAYIEPFIGYIATPLAVYYRDIPQSITKKYVDTKYLEMLLDRHIAILRDHKDRGQGSRCVALILKNWCRELLASGRSRAVRRLIRKYRGILDGRFYNSMMVGSFVPWLYLWYQDFKKRGKAGVK